MADLKLSLIVGAVDKITAPVKKIIGVTGRLSASALKTRAELKRLGRQREGIKHFQSLGKRLGATSSEMALAHKRTAALGRQLAATANPTKKLRREFEAARRTSGALKKRHHEQQEGLHRLRNELGRVGIPTRGLAAAQRRLAEQTDRATRKLKDQQRRLARWQGVAERAGKVRGAAGATAASLGRTGLVAGGLAGVGVELFRRTFVDTAAQFERFETVLTTIEGSSTKAKASMRWISDFAVKTPYELEQVTDAFVKLRAYGMDPTRGLLRSLGDTSAAMGKDLMQAVEAIADAVTGENERLKEFGIKARTKGDVITYEYTLAGETKTAQANARDRAQIEKTLRGIFDSKFSGAMAGQSRTFIGMISNLMDQWTRFQQMVMKHGVFDWLKTKLSGLLDKLNELAASGQLDKFAKQVSGKLIKAFEWLWETGQKAWPVIERVAGGIGKMADAVGGLWNLIKIGLGLKLAKDLMPLGRAVGDLGRFALSSEGGLRKFVGRLSEMEGGPLGAAKGKLAIFGGALKGLASRAIPVVGAALRGLSLASLVSPIGIAVAAITTAALLIYKYWQPLKAFFGGVWEGFKQALQPVVESLAPLGDAFAVVGAAIKPVVDWFKSLFAPVKASEEQLAGIARVGKVVGGILGTVVGGAIKLVVWQLKVLWNINPLVLIYKHWGRIKEFFKGLSLAGAGRALLETLGKGIRAGAGKVWEALKSVLGKVRDLLPFSDAKSGPLSRLTASGGSILGTLGEGIRRMDPVTLKRPLARALGSATAGLALTLPVTAQAAPAVPPARSASAAYQTAPASPSGAHYIDNSSVHIQQLTIHQQPGENARELADRIIREIADRRRQHDREALHDDL